MPDAAARVEPYGLYFCDNGGAGRDLLGKLVAGLVSEFGPVTIAELEDDGCAGARSSGQTGRGGDRSVIASAGNTVVPAYLALLAGGYRVQREETAGPEELWRADRPDRTLIAEDPVTLLGLAAMRELRGPDWAASDAEIDEFLRRFYPEES